MSLQQELNQPGFRNFHVDRFGSVVAIDEPGAGGANHEYVVYAPDSTERRLEVSFQNGPLNEAGINGTTNEHLLAILIDRMRAFQSGPFTCRENALALTKLEEAVMWLNQRTANREAHGVEGTHEV